MEGQKGKPMDGWMESEEVEGEERRREKERRRDQFN
jgi:hypothetical protein